MPGFFRSRQEGTAYALLDDETLNHDENNLLTQDSELNENVSSNYISDDSDSETSFRIFNLKRFHIPKINFGFFKQSRGKRILDITICLFCLVFVLNVSTWLGYNTLRYHTPVIDKSYRAFGIPNHEAWLNYGALQAAKKNHTPFYHGSLAQRKGGKCRKSISDNRGLKLSKKKIISKWPHVSIIGSTGQVESYVTWLIMNSLIVNCNEFNIWSALNS